MAMIWEHLSELVMKNCASGMILNTNLAATLQLDSYNQLVRQKCKLTKTVEFEREKKLKPLHDVVYYNNKIIVAVWRHRISSF